MKISKILAGVSLCALAGSAAQAQTSYYKFVDPFIGSEAQGNVVIGPSRPHGMVKPSPDNNNAANSGYNADLSVPVYGFSQLHVSGTGGGAKYGNISIMPFAATDENFNTIKHTSLRKSETTAAGYYSALLTQSNIKTEITAASRVVFYRFNFAGQGDQGIKLDAGTFFGNDIEASGKTPSDESQRFIGSEIELVSDTEVRGYNRVRGGWNMGGPYTVYFYAVFDKPFNQFKTWKAGQLFSGVKAQLDTGKRTGALLSFKGDNAPLQVKIGISFISTAKAKFNVDTEVPGWKFDDVLGDTQQVWERLLSRIEIDKSATDAQKRMFYTGLYHTMLMPVDRTGENPLWKSDQPYYDDFYAIWDTFRSSHPLITLIDPKRQTEIVNSLVDIYRHDGYMPDARSGNSNGRTQGGSHADVLIADAYAKGLKGIDYELALQAVLKDADVPPGGNEEQEGRGGLPDYNKLGYVSSDYPRAGTRTVEYALDDFGIALVAKGLGHDDVFKRFSKQANNWQNLWRNVSSEGSTGFIMPKDAKGKWIDQITCSVKDKPSRAYKPTDVDKGSCVCWWCSFLYEGNSWEYSLFVPHDVNGLIKHAGGPIAFEKRLDTLFNKPYYNVANEPSFLSPNLYHWIGKPDRSSDRIHEIVNAKFSDARNGIPGNDDSGAMSSWLAFRMLGIYPNAGESYYLISTPFVTESTIHLANGNDFKIVAKNLSAQNRYIQSAKLNDQPVARAWIEHSEIEAGGVLELEMADKPGNWGTKDLPPSLRF